MRVALACTWNPRGELPRLLRLFPQMEQVYERLAIVVGPKTAELVSAARPRQLGHICRRLRLVCGHIGSPAALSQARIIHDADLTDCCAGWKLARTNGGDGGAPAAGLRDPRPHRSVYRTHPQALLRTEAISNLSLPPPGPSMDVSAVPRFSRRAADFLGEPRPGTPWAHAAGRWLLQRPGLPSTISPWMAWTGRSPDQPARSRLSGSRSPRPMIDPQNWASARMGFRDREVGFYPQGHEMRKRKIESDRLRVTS
jgi:hypothetical protein